MLRHGNSSQRGVGRDGKMRTRRRENKSIHCNDKICSPCGANSLRGLSNPPSEPSGALNGYSPLGNLSTASIVLVTNREALNLDHVRCRMRWSYFRCHPDVIKLILITLILKRFLLCDIVLYCIFLIYFVHNLIF